MLYPIYFFCGVLIIIALLEIILGPMLTLYPETIAAIITVLSLGSAIWFYLLRTSTELKERLENYISSLEKSWLYFKQIDTGLDRCLIQVISYSPRLSDYMEELKKETNSAYLNKYETMLLDEVSQTYLEIMRYYNDLVDENLLRLETKLPLTMKILMVPLKSALPSKYEPFKPEVLKLGLKEIIEEFIHQKISKENLQIYFYSRMTDKYSIMMSNMKSSQIIKEYDAFIADYLLFFKKLSPLKIFRVKKTERRSWSKIQECLHESNGSMALSLMIKKIKMNFPKAVYHELVNKLNEIDKLNAENEEYLVNLEEQLKHNN